MGAGMIQGKILFVRYARFALFIAVAMAGSADGMMSRFTQRTAKTTEQVTKLLFAKQSAIVKTRAFNAGSKKAFAGIAGATAFGFGAYAANKQSSVQCEGFETQTEAHWSLDSSKNINPNKDLKARCIARERELKDTHYVFYHLQPAEVIVIQDVLRAFYELRQGVELRKDFCFLRCPWHEDVRSLPHVNDWLHTEYDPFRNSQDPHHLQFDWCGSRSGCACKKIKGTQLLSANLALHGSETRPIDSSFRAFGLGSSVGGNSPPSDLLNDTFRHYGLSEEQYEKSFKDRGLETNLDKLKVLLRHFQRRGESSILAVFIKRDRVDDCAYLAQAYGHPYSRVIVAGDFDNGKGRHLKISSVLEKYKSQPVSIAKRTWWESFKYSLGYASASFENEFKNEADRLQARILMRSEILDPVAGVIIDEKTTLSLKERESVRRAVNEIVREAYADRFLTLDARLARDAKRQLMQELMSMPS